MMTLQLFSLRTTFTLILLGGLFAVPSAAGPLVPNRAPADPPTLIKHLQAELRSSDFSNREAALVDIVALANCVRTCTIALQSVDKRKVRIQNETDAGTVVDLTALIPDLLATYRTGPVDGHRLLALAALLHIGNERALEQLVGESARQSDGIRKDTHRKLVGFYLARYPELAEQATRTRTLSIEDVRRAKALRVKAVRTEEQK
jgi:hypothetical protein